jgi:hypothetical protein
MRAFRSSAVLAGLALAGLLVVPAQAPAQNLQWGEDAGRALRPGVYIPYDAAPFSHRYNYPEGPYLFGGNPALWWYLYELDHQERLATFGDRYGPDHPPLFNRLLDRHRR